MKSWLNQLTVFIQGCWKNYFGKTAKIIIRIVSAIAELIDRCNFSSFDVIGIFTVLDVASNNFNSFCHLISEIIDIFN